MIEEYNGQRYYKINIPVRISDINYGGHLGHAELTKITHQARLKMLKHFSLSETDIEGAGIIVRKMETSYKREAFFDDILSLHIRISEVTKSTCVFEYQITKDHETPVATVHETIMFMNYSTRKPVRVPSQIHDLYEIEFKQ